MRYDVGLLQQHVQRAVSRADHVDKRGRAQRLVLKAAEPDQLEAYRLLLRRYEPVSTVTTVPKLVDLLATTFSGDLMDSLTKFERLSCIMLPQLRSPLLLLCPEFVVVTTDFQREKSTTPMGCRWLPIPDTAKHGRDIRHRAPKRGWPQGVDLQAVFRD